MKKNFKPEFHSGDITTVYVQNLCNPKVGTLVNFIDFVRDTRGVIKRRLQTAKSKWPNHVKERWLANVEGSVIEVIIPQFYDTATYTEQLGERPPGSYPDNTYEVNLLQDSLEEWLSNTRDFKLKDPHLERVIGKYNQFIEVLSDYYNTIEDQNLKSMALKILVHKTTPTLGTFKELRRYFLTKNKIYEEVISTVNASLQ